MAVFVFIITNSIRTFEKKRKLCQKIKKVFIQELYKKTLMEIISVVNIYWITNTQKKTSS